MKNNYLIETTDQIILKNMVNTLIKKHNFNNPDINYYEVEEEGLSKALEDLETYSFLSLNKVVIINNFDKIKIEDNKYIEELIKYVKNNIEDNILIIQTKKYIVKDNKFLKELKKYLEIIDTNIDSKKYIKQELKDYKISMSTINLLDSYCLGDFNKIYNECLKLKNYKIEEKEITDDDIKNLVMKKMGDSTEITFSFVRTLATKDKKNSIKLFRELLDYNIEPLSLIGLLASQFRIMYQVKVLFKKNNTIRDIASLLDCKEFRVKKTMELNKYFSEKEILNLIIKLEEVDYNIKTTGIDPIFLLEVFIMNL